MNTATHHRYRGLGQTRSQNQGPSTSQEISQIAQSASTGTMQILGGNPVGGAGSFLLGAASVPSPASPFLGIAGAITELLGAIGIGRGCGQTCVVATQFANQAGTLLQQNLNTYLALPSPRTQSQQAAALSNFDQIWAALISAQACGNPALGDAGKNCISDRQRGGCKWKDSSGNCWNWFVAFRDPIANDPNVQPDSSAVSSVAGAFSGISPVVIFAAAGLLLFLVLA